MTPKTAILIITIMLYSTALYLRYERKKKKEAYYMIGNRMMYAEVLLIVSAMAFTVKLLILVVV